MRNKTPTDSKNSLRTLILFCLAVFLVVGISLTYKLVSLIRESTYNGRNTYTVAVISDNTLEVFSLQPQKKSIIHLIVPGVTSVPEAKKRVGMFIQGEVRLTKQLPENTHIASLLQKGLLHKDGVQTSIPSYDLFRLSLFARSIQLNAVKTERFTKDTTDEEVDGIIQKLFLDEALSEDNKTIEIRNSTGITGLGTRLERAIRNIGGNVIAVSSTENIEAVSQIRYAGEGSYTVELLTNTLSMPTVESTEQTLSDIIIVIGKDRSEQITY